MVTVALGVATGAAFLIPRNSVEASGKAESAVQVAFQITDASIAVQGGKGTAVVKGRAMPGTIVSALIDSQEVAWATVPLDGQWTLRFPHDDYLKKPVVLRSLEADDNASMRDRSAPIWLKPGSESAEPDTETDQPKVAKDQEKPRQPLEVVVKRPGHGNTIRRGKVEFDGSAPPGHLVSIMVDGNFLGRTTADVNGRWVFLTRLSSPGADRKVVALARNPVTREVTKSEPVLFSVW
jgi:hypothetical protein